MSSKYVTKGLYIKNSVQERSAKLEVAAGCADHKTVKISPGELWNIGWGKWHVGKHKAACGRVYWTPNMESQKY